MSPSNKEISAVGFSGERVALSPANLNPGAMNC